VKEIKLLLIFCCTAVLLLAAGSALAAPELTIPKTSFDFGFVPQNASISHSFWLYSTGDDTLKVVRVRPG
jgi:hypothetical protein